MFPPHAHQLGHLPSTQFHTHSSRQIVHYVNKQLQNVLSWMLRQASRDHHNDRMHISRSTVRAAPTHRLFSRPSIHAARNMRPCGVLSSFDATPHVFMLGT